MSRHLSETVSFWWKNQGCHSLIVDKKLYLSQLVSVFEGIGHDLRKYLLSTTHYSLCDAWNSIRNNFFASCARRPYVLQYFFRPGSDVPYLRNGLQIPFAIHWRLHFFLVQYYSHFTVGNLLHPIDVQIDHVCPEDFNCTDLWPNKDVMLLVKKRLLKCLEAKGEMICTHNVCRTSLGCFGKSIAI